MMCPKKFSNPKAWTNCECEKGACAWWIEDTSEGNSIYDCSIKLIAERGKL